MKKLTSYLLLIALSSITIAADKHSLSFKKITVPEAPPVAAVMVAYMDITNSSNKAKTIKQISSPQFKRVEIHNMSMSDGMMKMEQMQSLKIKPRATVKLETGGLHIMLIKPVKPLKHGDKIELTFKLASGELTTISSSVQKVDLTDSHKHHHHHH